MKPLPPLKQVDGAEMLDFLLNGENRRAPALDLFGQPFEIEVYRHEFGLLVANAYRDGKILPDCDGVIIGKPECISWLEDAVIEQDAD